MNAKSIFFKRHIQSQVEVSPSLLQELLFLCTSQRTDCLENPKRKFVKSIGNSMSSNDESARTSSCLVCSYENDKLLIEHPMFQGFKTCKSCMVSTTFFI